ncbi:unnamed protein product [Calicophoron daubneyi]|uniref:PDZ domain-containing protein n=1 Tax=Calicophoron daubneyi TaxID=300641 RepID=A0AAV2TJJ1_CALDB
MKGEEVPYTNIFHKERLEIRLVGTEKQKAMMGIQPSPNVGQFAPSDCRKGLDGEMRCSLYTSQSGVKGSEIPVMGCIHQQGVKLTDPGSMKKFTLSYATDSDSAKSVHSLQNVHETSQEPELPRITVLNILLPSSNKKTTLKVIGDAVLLQVKRRLTKAFGSILSDAQNMGLFFPGDGGKMGKFLEEERLLSEYTADRTEVTLEFIYKRRIDPPIPISPLDKFPKDVAKAFLRYVSRGDCKKVEKILAKGFDPNFQCPKTGETPLTIAVLRSKPHNMITTLIAGGAHRDYYSRSGLSPLHKAAAIGNFEAVKTLLDFGQSPNCLDSLGLTPLYYNILCDQDTKICHRLLYEHSELGITDRSGLQEIHQAARLNRVDQINLLIMYGADVNSRIHRPTTTTTTANCDPSLSPVNTQHVDGDTPLHVAASTNQRASVMRLLSWGADPILTNSKNLTAIQLALECGHTELAETIRLFRGDSHQSEYGGPFLPTPTYNPKRRMRHAPPNSYITEPSALVPCGCGMRTSQSYYNRPQINQLGSDENTSPKANTFVVSQTKATFPSSPLPRAVSMGNLIQAINKQGLQRWENRENFGDKLALPPMVKPTCDPFFEASQLYYDTQQNRCGVSSATLARRSKTTVNLSDNESTLAGRRVLSNESRYNMMYHPDRGNDGHLSKLTHPECYSMIQSKLQQWRSTENLSQAFQREGSQTDSGISNSSAEKKLITDNMDLATSPTDPPGQGISVYGRNGKTRVEGQINHTQAPLCLRSSDPEKTQQPISRNISNRNTTGQNASNSTQVNATRNLVRSSTSVGDSRCTTRTVSPNDVHITSAVQPGVPRTVVLQRPTFLSTQKNEARPSFGLSIRTVKNIDVIASFQPTPSRPSLQIAKRIVPNSPAFKAGIREGDFILKINGVDVTRSSLEEVVDLLSTTLSQSVCLTVITPAVNLEPQKMQETKARTSKESSVGTSSYLNQAESWQGPGDRRQRNNNQSGQPQTTRFLNESDLSGPPSARSSDRTTCSSNFDEGVWSQSTGASSGNASGRSSLLSGPRGLNMDVSASGPKIHTLTKQPFGDSHPPRVRLRGLPRSKTTSGISNASDSQNGSPPMAQSFYFPRNPRFHRVGSQDSQSSVSSGGAPVHSPSAHPVGSGGKSASSAGLQNEHITIRPHHRLIKRCTDARRHESTETAAHIRGRSTTTFLRRTDISTPTTQVTDSRTYRLIPGKHSSVTGSRAMGESPTDSELVLPPPAQFLN